MGRHRHVRLHPARRGRGIVTALAVLAVAVTVDVAAATTDDTFAVDTTTCPDAATTALADGEPIRVGLSYPLSGALASAGEVGYGVLTYLEKINAEEGGVNGHPIEVTLLDDAYEPGRAVTNVTQLIGAENVMLVNQAGSPLSAGTRPLLEEACVPQLWLPVAGAEFADPLNHPWTTPMLLPATVEVGIWLQYLTEEFPDGGTVVPIAFDNDFGRGYVSALTAAAEGTNFELLEPVYHEATVVTLTNETLTAAAQGPDIVVGISGPGFCSKILSGLDQLDYAGQIVLSQHCSDITGNFLPVAPSGDGAIVVSPFKIVSEDAAATDPAIAQFYDDVAAYGAGAAVTTNVASGYQIGFLIVETLRAASDLPGGLTRANIATAAWNLDTEHPFAYEGVRFRTAAPDDPILSESAAILRYDADAQSYQVLTVIDASATDN